MIEPLLNGRNIHGDVKTGRASLARDKPRRSLFTGLGGVRLTGGVNLQQVLARNVGTLPAMSRENAKWKPHKAPSTNAQVRDGLIRSSEEGR
jgi:hypothetical protein